MWNHMSKWDHANIIAGFANQNDSEDALLRLRMAGFNDDRIGYYYPSGKGQMRDHLAHDHRLAATIIGGIIGVGVGLLFCRLEAFRGLHLDPNGLFQTAVICGSLLLGTAGGLMGIWSSRRGAAAPIQTDTSDTFVIAVDAGPSREQVSTIFHNFGGHELPTPHPSNPI
jgi:hypothetical protein